MSIGTPYSTYYELTSLVGQFLIEMARLEGLLYNALIAAIDIEQNSTDSSAFEHMGFNDRMKRLKKLVRNGGNSGEFLDFFDKLMEDLDRLRKHRNGISHSLTKSTQIDDYRDLIVVSEYTIRHNRIDTEKIALEAELMIGLINLARDAVSRLRWFALDHDAFSLSASLIQNNAEKKKETPPNYIKLIFDDRFYNRMIKAHSIKSYGDGN